MNLKKILSLLLLNLIIISCSTQDTQPAKSVSKYDRKEWGNWSDGDRNCINTRHEILKARSLVKAKMDKKGCKVIGGRWQDFYSSDILTDPKKIEIDHVVPVKLAHELSEGRWSPEKKREFYNDLENLVVTSKKFNRQKSANDILMWQPADKQAACRQMTTWFKVKQKYSLKISDKEKQYKKLLADCG